jgi:glycosyltransferase involved in cell wall biosynthesis
MHILVTADTVGGVWTYAREFVSGLALRGVKVTLVSFGDIPTPQQTQWMQGLTSLDYHPTAFKLEWMQDSEADLAASAEYLQAVIRDTSPDLLHLNQFYYGALECDVPRIVVAHSDVVSWWVAVHQQEPPDSAWMRWYRKVVTRGIAGATAVVAPSRWMLEQISRYYIQPEASQVVYNGRTPGLFNPHLTKDDLIVTVGRQWDRGKNAGLLLQREMPAPVCIVGSDRHPESQGRAFGGDRPNAAVQFEAQQDEKQLGRLLARASIYAATSCYEPFGLAPVEAALSRCAIVASDIPSFRELWDGAGIFFRNNDADSLQQALQQLVDDRELRRSYGNLALSRAQQRFSASRMVEEYLALYKTLAGASALTA